MHKSNLKLRLKQNLKLKRKSNKKLKIKRKKRRRLKLLLKSIIKLRKFTPNTTKATTRSTIITKMNERKL